MIGSARAAVFRLLRHLELNVHMYLPDDVNQLPCVVVNRPSVEPGTALQGADLVSTVPVIVVGRRLGNDDAQEQLDEIADKVAVRFITSYAFTVTPEVETIAGQLYPSYLFNVAVPYRLCPPERSFAP